jgi:hypothetical protein
VMINKEFLILLLAIVLCSCKVQNKLPVAKTIRIIDRSISTIDTIGPGKYISYDSVKTYKWKFTTELKNRLAESNLTVIDTGTRITDYTLVLLRFMYTEKLEPYIVHDSLSLDLGKSFSLRKCVLKVESTLYDSKAIPLDTLAIENYSVETLVEHVNFLEYMLFPGRRNSYHYKLKGLDANIFGYIALGCAKVTSKKMVKTLMKM